MYLWAQLQRWRKLSERGWFMRTMARHLHEIPINLSGRHLGLRTNFIWDCHSHGIYSGGGKTQEWGLNQPLWLLNSRFVESFGNIRKILYFPLLHSRVFYFLNCIILYYISLGFKMAARSDAAARGSLLLRTFLCFICPQFRCTGPALVEFIDSL